MSPQVKYTSLPELLLARSRTSTAELGYLDAEGNVAKTQTYSQLFADAQVVAQRLVSAGLKTDGTDIVVTSFADHESHILIFWACCFAGIPFCPAPPLHPDPSRQLLFFEHLQTLFNKPTYIAEEDTIRDILNLVPSIKAISATQLRSIAIADAASLDIFPNRYPKADDIVCLMLTSGSTGNSKAVGLRHSNLLSSIEGKIKHHGTTSASRFLNWIAFDHVACVTEVHLQALRADASQYHVAPAAVIRKPTNLLEWCSKLQISYTFSPNFLLGQICRDFSKAQNAKAMDLSCVKVLISGGEAVPTKTAVEFTAILEELGAPRNALRAGFGMTETGAGCIYDTQDIPRTVSESSAKYLSLGTCCDGVSMRVVDKNGAVCPPFQEGQLQLSGPSVFRGYFNNPKATAESFTSGWFITGDTAQLDADGMLHLMGRDKDTVNINGVKHPSGDIENYLEDLKIDGLMKSFVYVCPMRLAGADTETFGVFYQHQVVVEGALNEADISAIRATSRAIRSTCAVFCSQAPHVVLPLPRKSFVKTALGKVSRSALAKAYQQGDYKSIEELLHAYEAADSLAEEGPQSAVEEVLYDSVITLFNMSTQLRRSQNLFDMGASSMHLMQLKQLLQERLSIKDIPTIEILRRPEVGQLCDYLTALTAQIAATGDIPSVVPYDPLVCFNPTGSKPPLFLVHPGIGEVLVFINLAHVLDDDRPVYAFRARGFDAGQIPFQTFDEMVDTYVERIQKAYNGPYFIAGYSFGGAVAYEVGKKLVQAGKTVAWVGVFNLPPHIAFRMKEHVWLEVLVNLSLFLGLIKTADFDGLKSTLQKNFPELVGTDAEPSTSVDIISWVFANSDMERVKELQLKPDDLRRWVVVAYELSYRARNYEPVGYVAKALLSIFCAIPLPSMGTKEEFKRDRLSAWKDFSDEGKLEYVDVDGEHFTMMNEEHVHSFARNLKGAMSRATALLGA